MDVQTIEHVLLYRREDFSKEKTTTLYKTGNHLNTKITQRIRWPFLTLKLRLKSSPIPSLKMRAFSLWEAPSPSLSFIFSIYNVFCFFLDSLRIWICYNLIADVCQEEERGRERGGGERGGGERRGERGGGERGLFPCLLKKKVQKARRRGEVVRRWNYGEPVLAKALVKISAA